MKLYYQFVVSLIIFIAVCLGALGYFLNTEDVREFAKISRLKGELPQEITYQMLVDAVMAPILEGYDGGKPVLCRTLCFGDRFTYKDYNGYPSIDSNGFEWINKKKMEQISKKSDECTAIRDKTVTNTQADKYLDIAQEYPNISDGYFYLAAINGNVWAKNLIYYILIHDENRGYFLIADDETKNQMRERLVEFNIAAFTIIHRKAEQEYLLNKLLTMKYLDHWTIITFTAGLTSTDKPIPQWLKEFVCEGYYKGNLSPYIKNINNIQCSTTQE